MKIGRIKPRWTLFGLMVLIAVVALPLAWYVHRVREIDSQRMLSEARTAHIQAQIKKIERAIDEETRRQLERLTRQNAQARP